jgi:hypothetical protein
MMLNDVDDAQKALKLIQLNDYLLRIGSDTRKELSFHFFCFICKGIRMENHISSAYKSVHDFSLCT